MDAIGQLLLDASIRSRGKRAAWLNAISALDHLDQIEWAATQGTPGCYTTLAFTYPGWWRVDIDVPTAMGTPSITWYPIDLGQPGTPSWSATLAPLLATLRNRISAGRRYVEALPGTSWKVRRPLRFVVYVTGRCMGHVELLQPGPTRAGKLAAFRLDGLKALSW